jgi:small-conductance mechanosensitive channel
MEARFHAADAWVAATRQETETLGTLVNFNSGIEVLWNQQYLVLNSQDPPLRQDAFEQLESAYARLQQASSYSEDDLRLAISDESNQQAAVDLIGVDSPLRHHAMETLEAFRLKRQIAERIRLVVERTDHLLGRWLSDYRRTYDETPWAERMKQSLLFASNGVVKSLHFELFTVNDTVDLEGKKVNITRGVTLDTLLTALAVFAAGFWFANWLTQRFQRMLVKQFNMGETQANVLRRWALIGFSFILSVIVLTFARIPLTVFAFLGGALAIGVGFGTQTMLKNLISGLVMLAARKIKVGDIVEVDGILGKIIEIDIRSSTVRGFDGVETMVPNSTFLESKVANWTYTSSELRRSVRVGVAYGSPSAKVIRLLLECAEHHRQVLAHPKPHVWLEDLGENYLEFRLYFWIVIGLQVNSYQVMSDMRCAILDALENGGIVIPILQPDIHVQAGQTAPVNSVGTAILDG